MREFSVFSVFQRVIIACLIVCSVSVYSVSILSAQPFIGNPATATISSEISSPSSNIASQQVIGFPGNFTQNPAICTGQMTRDPRLCIPNFTMDPNICRRFIPGNGDPRALQLQQNPNMIQQSVAQQKYTQSAALCQQYMTRDPRNCASSTSIEASRDPRTCVQMNTVTVDPRFCTGEMTKDPRLCIPNFTMDPNICRFPGQTLNPGISTPSNASNAKDPRAVTETVSSSSNTSTEISDYKASTKTAKPDKKKKSKKQKKSGKKNY
ncbi:MAG: hypothetical protein HQM10_24040 [Candidatus Riflebacteria bacterium]|nr:hypothetical protein [Candidatus Riflebacteria bacterium]